MTFMVTEGFDAVSSDMAKAFNGRNVVLLGSAPGEPEFRVQYDVLSSVNGSHAGFGVGKVGVLFLNSFSLTGSAEVCSKVRDALTGFECEILAYLDMAEHESIPDLGQSKVWKISRDDRHEYLTWATGDEFEPRDAGDKVPSTGVTAALLMSKAGADVHMVGFSTADGHSLLPGSHRMHKDQDGKYLSMLNGAP